MSRFYDFEVVRDIWANNPLIILDTNVLLDLYRYSSDATEDIIGNFTNIIEKFWLPNQVYVEFIEKKDEVRRAACNKYRNLSEEIALSLEKTKKDCLRKLHRYSKFKYPKTKELKDVIEKKIDDIKLDVSNHHEEIATEVKNNRKLLKKDIVVAFVSQLKATNDVGESLSIQELLSIYKEGEIRYKYKIPPGYLDEEKDKNDDTKTKKFGDLLVWKQILNKSINLDRPVILIQNEEKPDWWEMNGSEIISPRNELIGEYNQATLTNDQFLMMSLLDFVSYLSIFLNIAAKTQIELGSEEIVWQCIDEIWEEIFNKEFHNICINQNLLLDHLCSGSVNDVNFEFDNLEFSDINADIDDEQNLVYFTGDFTVWADASMDIYISREYSEPENAKIKFEGSFTLEVSIVYEDEEEEIYNFEFNEMKIDNVEINELVRDYELCIKCGKEIGVYVFNDEGMICENCSSRYEVCTSCGKVLEKYTDLVGDGMCKSCYLDF